MRQLIVFFGLALTLAGGLIAYQIYNKGHKDLQKTAPDHSLTASALFSAFNLDEQAANGNFLDKVLEVSGEVSRVEKNEKGNFQLYLASEDPMFGIICDMDPGKEPPSLSPGDLVIIRGICTGYLMDVALNRCVIIKTMD